MILVVLLRVLSSLCICLNHLYITKVLEFFYIELYCYLAAGWPKYVQFVSQIYDCGHFGVDCVVSRGIYVIGAVGTA